MQNGFSPEAGYSQDAENQSSIARSGINTRNLCITDEAAHIEQTGKTAQQSKAEVYTDTTTEAAAQRSGRLNDVFDRKSVQRKPDWQRTVSLNLQAADSKINKYPE